MKKTLSLGIIVLAYGLSLPALGTDTATLTISGTVVAPTCSTEVVNAHLQQRCGNTTHVSSTEQTVTSVARGVTTELVPIPGSDNRQIILNRYD
ncbi:MULTISPECIES: YehE family protein [Citrobacter]|uniref:YehE family protein n=1 Tax=Citrobacter TaxID=544 RepID=UPI00214D9125|nr:MULTISPECIES: YehE family protein [Citrobacter]EKT9261666.1 DUF2574 family protein [Citrobacter freundii]EKU4728896.1 DUF2574 family protein [Citrobacter freundii]EKV2289995.1 DUF2574 family protein [Citrobacter freundii]EKW0767007.1 DUF2574 family protein [Citrobacter freundii]MCR3679017.1 YehE family protein [Citrobacter freundii]